MDRLSRGSGSSHGSHLSTVPRVGASVSSAEPAGGAMSASAGGAILTFLGAGPGLPDVLEAGLEFGANGEAVAAPTSRLSREMFKFWETSWTGGAFSTYTKTGQLSSGRSGSGKG